MHFSTKLLGRAEVRTAMAPDDESVEFSLKELTRLEDERIHRIEDEKAAHARAQMQAEMQEEASRKAAELDALAQREAMQKAIVEQARLEVEARTRADERERERRHEIEMATLRAQPRALTPPSIAPLAFAALLGGLIATGVAASVHVLVTTPNAAARIASVERERDDARARGDDLERALDAARRTMADLESRRAVEGRRENDAPAKPSASSRPGPARPNGPRPPRAEAPAPVSSTCDTDPLCGAIRPR
jgi:hypothetical protein